MKSAQELSKHLKIPFFLSFEIDTYNTVANRSLVHYLIIKSNHRVFKFSLIYNQLQLET